MSIETLLALVCGLSPVTFGLIMYFFREDKTRSKVRPTTGASGATAGADLPATAVVATTTPETGLAGRLPAAAPTHWGAPTVARSADPDTPERPLASAPAPGPTSTLAPAQVEPKGEYKIATQPTASTPALDGAPAPTLSHAVSPALSDTLGTRATRKAPSPSPPRQPAALIDPAHYRRHSGVPGVLYLARNDERREHVYKIGYTVGLPPVRIAALNNQVEEANDIGRFRLLHSVVVGSSYDMEQALFDVLATRRIAAEREFFVGPEALLKRAMDAIALMAEDGGLAVNAFLDSAMWAERPPMPVPVLPEVPVPPRHGSDGGWVYVCQNYWHAPGTAVYTVTKETERAVLNRLNAAQRTLTSQVGFYRVVACKAVGSTALAGAQAAVAFAPYRVDARKHFIRAELNTLRAIVAAIDEGVPMEAPVTAAAALAARRGAIPPPGPPRPSLSVASEIRVEVVLAAAPPKLWAAWTALCGGCGTRLRYLGAIGATGPAGCPLCHVIVHCTIGAQRVRLEPLRP
ncbi:GIY-YIG nuclease family protein [Variovorax sp. LT1P1]|uniref:GIY-YIG nuclease family protein n=1 Tax=Variovorax sp. LT1P1 TaxID=3443730 RepID=UPI003F45CFBC